MRYQEESLNLDFDNNYCLSYSAFQDFKKSSMKQIQSHTLVKKVLKIYIQYTALIYEINLKMYQM